MYVCALKLGILLLHLFVKGLPGMCVHLCACAMCVFVFSQWTQCNQACCLIIAKLLTLWTQHGDGKGKRIWTCTFFTFFALYKWLHIYLLLLVHGKQCLKAGVVGVQMLKA